ncbi:hypothetical protein CC78DRAFT_620946 [Lojkania enalia]|uniref:Uncharacterized protein n=1 Tax=Lojkania enalia TaxID=147567 RepID=A0A9P4K162_9PLEO|nr:hypothetical protein CC78DRAFT_620946 [Didymosphaeria enalia]
MSLSSSILLKNRTALFRNAKNHVLPVRNNILIENDKIAKIEKNLEDEDGPEVIDCRWTSDSWIRFRLVLPPGPSNQGSISPYEEEGFQIITVNSNDSPQIGDRWPGSPIKVLHRMNPFNEHILLSHSNRIHREDVDLIKSAKAHISSTPSTEPQMATGLPTCLDESFLNGKWEWIALQNSAYIIPETRLGLHNARNRFSEHELGQGKTTTTLPVILSVEAPFNFVIDQGTKAVRTENKIGSIGISTNADLAIFDAMGPDSLERHSMI